MKISQAGTVYEGLLSVGERAEECRDVVLEVLWVVAIYECRVREPAVVEAPCALNGFGFGIFGTVSQGQFVPTIRLEGEDRRLFPGPRVSALEFRAVFVGI